MVLLLARCVSGREFGHCQSTLESFGSEIEAGSLHFQTRVAVQQAVEPGARISQFAQFGRAPKVDHSHEVGGRIVRSCTDQQFGHCRIFIAAANGIPKTTYLDERDSLHMWFKVRKRVLRRHRFRLETKHSRQVGQQLSVMFRHLERAIRMS